MDYKAYDEDGILKIVKVGSEAEQAMDQDSEVSEILDPQTPVSGSSVIATNSSVYQSEEEKILTHIDADDFRDVTVSEIKNIYGAKTQVSSSAGWDPLNRSNNEASIRDGNLGNLAYNNTASGQAQGMILGLDMGSQKMINSATVYDWSATYIANEWEFIGTNDPSAGTYDILFSVQSHAFSNAPNGFSFNFPDATYRYFGVRCVSPANNSFFVLSEIEVFTQPNLGSRVVAADPQSYEVQMVSDTETQVKNLASERELLVSVRE